MRQYVIDELSFLERDNLDSYLKRTIKPAGLDGAFFLELPRDLWSENQEGHEKCGPFYFSVILEKELIRFEFLVRSSNNLHCSSPPGPRRPSASSLSILPTGCWKRN